MSNRIAEPRGRMMIRRTREVHQDVANPPQPQSTLVFINRSRPKHFLHDLDAALGARGTYSIKLCDIDLVT